MTEYLLPVAVLSALFIGLSAMLIVAERVLINYGICAIDINEGEEEIEVEGGDTLLSVLYEHEIYIPSACGGKGTCGECKVTVDSGGGPVLPTETPLLTRRERRSGVRLGCQVKVREDMEVRMPEEYLHVEEFASTVDEVEMLTEDIRFIRMTLDDPEQIEFRPGQYVQVQAPSSEGPVYRAYSISNPDYEHDRVELIVKLIPGGIGSTYLHNVEPGDPVTFIGPFGDFRLEESADTELVCVGGGCGMAPIRSIDYSVLKRQPERKVWMFFGAR
ncbi:MAG: FAD-binding oxidoreductase, partial [Planctomycetota bacterium]